MLNHSLPQNKHSKDEFGELLTTATGGAIDAVVGWNCHECHDQGVCSQPADQAQYTLVTREKYAKIMNFLFRDTSV